jgi:hypothetical protein
MRAAITALALAVAVGSNLWAATVRCDIRLNITDQDPAGLNVRASPAGPILAAIEARHHWVQVHVTAVSGDWVQIDKATLITEQDPGGTVIFTRPGWVALSKLGIEELNPNTRIHAAPSDDAPPVLSFDEGDEARIPHADVLGCQDDWLKVRVNGLVGWTRTFCANQFTTCV